MSFSFFAVTQVSDAFLPQAAIKFSLNDAITTHPPYPDLLSLLFSCDTSIDVSHDMFTVKPQLNGKSNQILSYCSGNRFLLPLLHQTGNKLSLDELGDSVFASIICFQVRSPRNSCFNRFLILLLNY